jgi:hypothetical protein
MKQIMLAFHNYALSGGGFPNRWCVNKSLTNTPRGWGVTMLPFMEEQDLFDSFDKKKAFHDPANQAVTSTVVSAYICPSTPSGIRLMDIGASTTASSKGIAGDYVLYHQLSYTGSGATCTGCKPAAPLSTTDTGLTKLNTITDGTAKTILCSEQAGRPDFYKLRVKQASNSSMTNPLFWGAWASFQSIQGQGFDITGTSTGGVCSMNCQNGQGAYSFHESGGVFGFCDGSARFITSDIPLALLLAMETRNGGEAYEE